MTKWRALAVLIVFAGLPVSASKKPVASGRIENLDTVADLIKYNQAAEIGFSTPGEGRIQRATGMLSRWDLPIPIAVDSGIGDALVNEAVAYWRSAAGL